MPTMCRSGIIIWVTPDMAGGYPDNTAGTVPDHRAPCHPSADRGQRITGER